jgi:hypothetical protein
MGISLETRGLGGRESEVTELLDDPNATPIRRNRELFRAGLVALGVPFLAIGVWAFFAPHSWYREFPGGGHHWITALGPYDEHLVRDFGALYMGLGLLLGYASVVLRRQLVQAALATLLVFSVPHFIFHLTKLDRFSTADNIENITTLALTVLLPALLLALSGRSAGPIEMAERPVRTPVEGGITYGTR